MESLGDMESDLFSDLPNEQTDVSAIDDDTRSTLKLSMLPGLGPRTLTALLDRFQTPNAVLEASDSQLASIRGVGQKLIRTIRTATDYVDVDSIVGWCMDNDVSIVRRGCDGFPQALESLEDTPPILFVDGEVQPVDELAVAIVGTRHGTNYGLKQATQFGYSLAKAGVTVVSGMARGIDSAAHEGALDGGGRTIAVLGSGLAEIYPPEHRGLSKAIASDGAVISEYPPYAKPRGGMFPQRNRLVAGLALATLVIEAPDRSGALITARLAGEINRDVLALPGPITSRNSRGCNQLIRDGATLVQTLDDILEALGPMARPVKSDSGHTVRNGTELKLSAREQTILDAIDESGSTIDSVIHATGIPAHQVMSTLSILEMRRLIRRLSGQHLTRV